MSSPFVENSAVVRMRGDVRANSLEAAQGAVRAASRVCRMGPESQMENDGIPDIAST